MNNFIIEMYINKLSINDIYSYIEKNNIKTNNKDVELIYKYIKTRWKDFLNNPDKILNEIKPKISSVSYNELLNLYNKYKKRIN